MQLRAELFQAFDRQILSTDEQSDVHHIVALEISENPHFSQRNRFEPAFDFILLIYVSYINGGHGILLLGKRLEIRFLSDEQSFQLTVHLLLRQLPDQLRIVRNILAIGAAFPIQFVSDAPQSL